MAQTRFADRQMVPHETVRKLQEMVRAGCFDADEKLPSQRILSEQLGISRSSLREAISVLETIGLVRVEVGRGVFVNPPTERVPKWRQLGPASPREVYEFRYCIEGHAAGLAAARLTADTLSSLESQVMAMREAALQRDVVTLSAIDRTFHDTIVRACGNAVIMESFFGAHRMIVETQRAPMGQFETLEQTVIEHRKIVAALKTRDFTTAASEMMRHIASTAIRAGIAIDHFQSVTSNA